MTVAFVAQIEQFVKASGLNLLTFDKGVRKDDIALKYLKDFHEAEGVLFVGKAQEKAWVFRSERRKNAQTGKSYAWIVRTTAMVNHYYFRILFHTGLRSDLAPRLGTHHAGGAGTKLGLNRRV